MTNLIKSVSLLTGLGTTDVLALSSRAPKTYRKYSIPKKNGGFRDIYHPAKETKLLQYAVMDLVVSKMPIHNCAVGYIRGLKSPLRVNADRHSSNPYFLRVDFNNFFSSIRPEDFFRTLERSAEFLDLEIDQADRIFLKNVLFIHREHSSEELAVGSPASPAISNAVMVELDKSIESLASAHDIVYTRYADDLVFSCSLKGQSKPFLKELEETVKHCKSPRLSINKKKTRFMSKNCRRTVTGLIITPEGKISIGRSKKRELRSQLHSFRRGKLDLKAIQTLQGYLAFLQDVEPSYINNLIQKYGANLINRAMTHSITHSELPLIGRGERHRERR